CAGCRCSCTASAWHSAASTPIASRSCDIEPMRLIAVLLCPILAAGLALPGILGARAAERSGVLLSGTAFLLSLFAAGRVAREGVIWIGPEECLRADGLSAILLLIVTGAAWVAVWFGEVGQPPGRRDLLLEH